MSDEESHSESEFYYPKDEELAKSEQNNMSKVKGQTLVNTGQCVFLKFKWLDLP